MYRAKDYRQQAWSSLKGKWSVIVVTQLIYLLIVAACDGLSRYYIGALAVILLTGPLEVGINKISLNVVRSENVEIVTLFDGFKDYTRAVVLWITNQIFTFLWTLLFIIPGIIKSLSYSMSYFILLDNPEMSANDARKKSMEMMDGNKWRLFCLELSYIGWMLLSVLTLGILYLWVMPSMRTATAYFYQSLLPEVKIENDSDEIDLDKDIFDNDVVVDNDNVQKVDDIVWKDEEKSDDITF
ncbi:MAG: DUF975 family protein [Clostridiales bacterium]|nr:DUF975 family protein [Clostridiales bacterium]